MNPGGEQYLAAQAAGVNVARLSLHPVELMVGQQTTGGRFDIYNSNAIGAQSHGLWALGATLPLLDGPPTRSRFEAFLGERTMDRSSSSEVKS